MVVPGRVVRDQLEPIGGLPVRCGSWRSDHHVLGVHRCGECGRRTEVVENPSRNVPRATLLGVALSACVYVGSTAVIFGLVPAEQIAKSPAPFETAVAAAIGAGPALVMAFCAMVKAAGALGGWTLLTAESARAAAEDGLFTRMFARVDRRGIPVAGLVAVGILMTAMEMFALAPSLGGLFSRLVSVSTLLIIPAYLFSSIALSLDKTENRSMRLVGLAAAVASILVAAAAIRPMHFLLLCWCWQPHRCLC